MYPRCGAASARSNVNVTFPLSRHRHRCARAASAPPPVAARRRSDADRGDSPAWNRKFPMLIFEWSLDVNPFNVIITVVPKNKDAFEILWRILVLMSQIKSIIFPITYLSYTINIAGFYSIGTGLAFQEFLYWFLILIHVLRIIILQVVLLSFGIYVKII